MSPRISWEGVFPAVTTQFNDDLSLNIDATAKVMDGLIRDGVSGLIICGSVGENTSLERKEKIAIMETAKSVAAGRVPETPKRGDQRRSSYVAFVKDAAAPNLTLVPRTRVLTMR